jgi:hypothetical protein
MQPAPDARAPSGGRCRPERPRVSENCFLQKQHVENDNGIQNSPTFLVFSQVVRVITQESGLRSTFSEDMPHGAANNRVATSFAALSGYLVQLKKSSPVL